jgi:hypothetical protein
MHGVLYSDLTIQLFSDILASKDGHILGQRRKLGDPQTVKLFSHESRSCVALSMANPQIWTESPYSSFRVCF